MLSRVKVKKVTALGRRLKASRRTLNWTLRDLERRSGVSNAFISQIETGHAQNVGTTVVVKLAKALNCDPAWLAGWRR